MPINPNFLSKIKQIKEDYKIKIIDSHVHPFDVMGMMKDFPAEGGNSKKMDFLSGGMMEQMRFGSLANYLSKLSFKFLPKLVINEIKAAYNNPKEKRILDEMDDALADEIALLPVEPWAKTESVHRVFNNKRFLLLGSIDVNGISAGEIEERIKYYVEEFKIIGLKLHPNLQNFKPQPKDNSGEIAEKLKIIYKTAEKYKIYLLFHGGFSDFTEYIDLEFSGLSRSKTNALLKNFCNGAGESEIFGKYGIPIIIAHLGHFGQNNLDAELLKMITGKYKNIYFDTAAVSPKMIKNAIELIGSNRIILGSDALYNRMAYSIYFVYLAAMSAKTDERRDDILANILGRNFYSKINCNK